MKIDESIEIVQSVQERKKKKKRIETQKTVSSGNLRRIEEE